jgi:catechol 2,3-dioxygenase-like lactoylglutathione lyase family enzyme
MLKKLSAVCLLVKNLDTSVVFYKNTFGLVIYSQDDGYVDFRLCNTLLQFHLNSGSGAVNAYHVSNVKESCEVLIQKGVENF